MKFSTAMAAFTSDFIAASPSRRSLHLRDFKVSTTIATHLDNCPYWTFEYGIHTDQESPTMVERTCLTFTIHGWTFYAFGRFDGQPHISVFGNPTVSEWTNGELFVTDEGELMATFAVMSAIRCVQDDPNATFSDVAASVAYQVAHCDK